MKKRFLTSFMAILLMFFMVGLVNATQLMPDFTNVPTGWTVDRYAPNSFSNIGSFEGRENVLGINITSAEGLGSRPNGQNSSFYNTQGMQYDVSGGAGSTLSADLWIDDSWSDALNGNVRTDMWGVIEDSNDAITGWPIIGFTNYGGTPQIRAWDNEGWHTLSTTINYGAWNNFAMTFTGNSIEYYVNRSLLYTDSSIDTTVEFSGVIMQAYNFFGDTSLSGANPVNYQANWSNAAPVPEPTTMLLFGIGILGIAGVSRKKRK